MKLEENADFVKNLTVRVRNIMLSKNDWMTITEVADAVGNLFNQSSVSAQMRAQRKFGYELLSRTNTDNPEIGKYQYKLQKMTQRNGSGLFRFLPDTEEYRKMEEKMDLMYKLNHEIYEEK